jgi:DNA-binding transcriptional LysR family regulator
MRESLIRRDVRRVVRVEVADDADFPYVLHGVRIDDEWACVKSNVVMRNMNYFEPSVSSLRLVAAILQFGKLTSAAEYLHMSQSAASHALKSIESQLGIQLFRRERDGLRLTDAGKHLCPLIEAALSNLERIRIEAAGLSAIETGNLRLAAVPSLLSTILPPIIREFVNGHPGVELSLFEGTDDEVHTWIRSGVAHIGFAALPVDGVESEEIARDEWLALVPERALIGRTFTTLRELARLRFLMSGGGCERHIMQIFALAHIVIPESMMVKQMPTIHAMVAENLGVSLIPQLSFTSGHACRTLPLKPRLFRQIGMIRSVNYAPIPAVEAWISLVRNWIKQTEKNHSMPSVVNQRLAKPKTAHSNRRNFEASDGNSTPKNSKLLRVT